MFLQAIKYDSRFMERTKCAKRVLQMNALYCKAQWMRAVEWPVCRADAEATRTSAALTLQSTSTNDNGTRSRQLSKLRKEVTKQSKRLKLSFALTERIVLDFRTACRGEYANRE